MEPVCENAMLLPAHRQAVGFPQQERHRNQRRYRISSDQEFAGVLDSCLTA